MKIMNQLPNNIIPGLILVRTDNDAIEVGHFVLLNNGFGGVVIKKTYGILYVLINGSLN